MPKPTCFVVMGFGQKTDFATGRTLDLDKTYRNMIKPAVEACGLECVRADEIRHSGYIDKPMYEHLLGADVVVADLSTANANAMYELGVRHALRPQTTIVIAESQLKYPFDVGHIAIRTYEHLGKGIDYDEAMRFRGELMAAIEAIRAAPRVDSPVYTFLPALEPPKAGAPVAHVQEATVPAAPPAPAPAPPVKASGAGGPPPPGGVTIEDSAVGQILAQANAAVERGEFAAAKALFGAIRAMRPVDQPWTLNDDYIVQRLALATYKAKLPAPLAALEEAQSLLAVLHPETSNDTETLGLWGSVQKRLWDLKLKSDPAAARGHIDAAVLAYERGFYLRNDYYNGINFAFLLNVRSSVSPPADAIADFVQARRVREEVIRICEPLASAIVSRADAASRRESEGEDDYWVLATLAEAFAGIGDDARANDWLSRAFELPAAKSWMKDTTSEQLATLRAMLADSPLAYLARERSAGSGE
jgi:hypothetical protein